jgi:hypothetical protein
VRLEHLLSGAMLSLYDSVMNCTIYLEKWYARKGKLFEYYIMLFMI